MCIRDRDIIILIPANPDDRLGTKITLFDPSAGKVGWLKWDLIFVDQIFALNFHKGPPLSYLNVHRLSVKEIGPDAIGS